MACVCDQLRDVAAGGEDVHESNTECNVYKNHPNTLTFLFELPEIIMSKS